MVQQSFNVSAACSSGISGTSLSAFTGSQTAGWQFNGDAGYDSASNTAVLVDGSVTTGQSGTIIYQDPISINSFTVSFDFQIVQVNGRADGLMFLMETNGDNVDGIGFSGLGGMGLSGYGVEFDIVDNGPCDGGNANHAGIDYLSSCPSNSGTPLPIATSNNLFDSSFGDISDGVWRTATIQLVGGQMSLAITDSSGTSLPVANLQNVTLPGFVSGTEYYLGFSAGSGSDLGAGPMASLIQIRNVQVTFPSIECF
jgi:hypothetical protein